MENIVALCRIIFGVIFFIKFYHSFDAEDIVWALGKPFGLDDFGWKALKFLTYLSLFGFTLGILTTASTLLLFVTFLVLNRKAALYGLEDVFFQTFIFYFLWTSKSYTWSIDSLLGNTPPIWKINLGQFPEIILSTNIAIIFLGAGICKLRSPMWIKGLGAYFFFLMPNFRVRSTKLIVNNKPIIYAINYSAVFFQLACLFAWLLPWQYFSMLCWFFIFSFSISLYLIFDLTWIGQAVTTMALIPFVLLFGDGYQSLYSLWITQNHSYPLVSLFLILSLLGSVWTAIANPIFFTNAPVWLDKIHLFFRYIGRVTWGMVPIDVFTEIHIEGPIVYRVFKKYTNGSEKEIFKIFSKDATPGPERKFKPSFFEVTSYKVAEAIMEFEAYGEIKDPHRKVFIQKLSEYIVKKYQKLGEDNFVLVYKVLQVIPPGNEFIGYSEWYLEEPWLDAFEVDKNGHITQLEKKVLKGPTGRDLGRHSFEYNPYVS
ncbi:MAG: hypothetical protein HOE90_11380 [Bacteriovoracaceae bacterium]|jgi:hypothetical protein|nr:hypothetical protein [Bacteriovoracaceae bacterium]